jgi:hypothetical protein
MTHLFSYIVVHDTGDAPCVDGGLVTLATCKPNIRKAAKDGDWVAGFHSISVRPQKPGWTPGRLIWIGQVSEVMSVGQYQFYYRDRSDAAYRRISEIEYERVRPNYHDDPKSIAKDLRAPVLIFDPRQTWYFSGAKPHALPDDLSTFFARGIGHRAVELDSVKLELLLSHMQALSDHRTFGLPRDRPNSVDLTRPPRCPIRAPYDARSAGSRSDSFPYSGERLYIADADLHEGK